MKHLLLPLLLAVLLSACARHNERPAPTRLAIAQHVDYQQLAQDSLLKAHQEAWELESMEE